MENENIEIESIEIESSSTDTVNETGVVDVSIYDVEEVENIPEKITLEETGEDNLIEEVAPAPDVSQDPEEPEAEFEQLLKEYLKERIEKSEGSEVEEIEGSENLTKDSTAELENDEPVTPDYSYVLDRIRSNTSHTYSALVGIQDSIDEYNDNNTLTSSINDISLTNALLILLFIALLFNGVLSFARRIF